MKLIKGFLAIAIISLVAISCKETKKEVSDESVDAIEVTDEVVTESMDANASDAESVIDSTIMKGTCQLSIKYQDTKEGRE